MIAAVLSILVLAIAAPLLHRFLGQRTGYLLAVLPLGIFIWLLSLWPQIAANESLRTSLVWFSAHGIHLSFFLDGLSYLFALLITGIGTLIVLYAGSYLKGNPWIGRFWPSLLLFMASMLGLVLADNLITLFVFWELTSFTSFLLIGFNHEDPRARRAATQALLVTFGGGLALLAGIVLIWMASGTLELSELLSAGNLLRNHPWYLPILILVLAGAFTKSAQFPFHFWLPNAMEAPTPVSAYLHSATMVKAGIYLLARLSPVLGGTDPWIWIVSLAGAFTMVTGAWLALCHRDLKQILAWSTVMALGTLTMLLGMGHPPALQAAVLFILGHSLYKGALFMTAGSVDIRTGTRDITLLGGLRSSMPVTALFAALAALSMAGIAPLIGFIAKEQVYEAAIGSGPLSGLMISLAVLANIAVVSAAGLVAIRPFHGSVKETPLPPGEAHWAMWSGPALLGTLGLLLGLFPSLIDHSLISSATGAIGGAHFPVELQLWHGFNSALFLSLITLLAGVALYLISDRLRESVGMRFFHRIFGQAPDRGYDLMIRLMVQAAGLHTRIVQSGYLRYYMGIMISVVVLSVGLTLADRVSISWPTGWSDIRYYEWVLATLILLSTYGAIRARRNLTAIASLAMSGFSITLLFLLNSAPDLALTQLLVDTLTVILFALVLIYLPGFEHEPLRPGTFRDLAISLTAGGTVTLLVLMVLSFEFDPFISNFYSENSYLLGHGRNIVNVILVDFRAFDTMGEITVLGMAGLGIYSLIKLVLGQEGGRKAFDTALQGPSQEPGGERNLNRKEETK